MKLYITGRFDFNLHFDPFLKKRSIHREKSGTYVIAKKKSLNIVFNRYPERNQ